MGTRILFLLVLALLLAACELVPTPAAGPSAQALLPEATPTPPVVVAADRSSLAPLPTDRPTVLLRTVTTAEPTEPPPTFTRSGTTAAPAVTAPPPAFPTQSPPPPLTVQPTRLPQRPGEVDPAAFLPYGVVQEEQSFGDYTVRVYKANPENWCSATSFEILRGGQRIYAYNGLCRLYIGHFMNEQQTGETVIPMGTDITADGIPDLVMYEYAGGAHCCSIYYIFQIGGEFRYLGSAGTDYFANVADLDGDGNWEFVVADWAYRNYLPGPWAECCAPLPKVILHYEDGSYRVAAELMRKPAPSSEEMSAVVAEIQSYREQIGASYDVSLRFWEYTLGLVYSGHAERVEPFWQRIWPDDEAIRTRLRDDMLLAFARSNYAAEIKALSAEWPWPDR